MAGKDKIRGGDGSSADESQEENLGQSIIDAVQNAAAEPGADIAGVVSNSVLTAGGSTREAFVAGLLVEYLSRNQLPPRNSNEQTGPDASADSADE